MRAESTSAHVRRAWQRAVAVALLGASALPALAASLVAPGHAGHWWSPERSGEGWVLEMLSPDAALLYWFTYDEDGGQRWMTAEGRVEDIDGDGATGQRIVFPQLVAPRGARFGAAFDPDDVVREDVGSATLTFDGCDSGVFAFDAFDQTQSIEVERLAHVMGAACETPHGVTGREVAAHAGLSGSWFDPAHNGEGFALHWASPHQAIVTWYTYDDDGDPVWMIGTGDYFDESTIRVRDLHTTRGARFGAAFEADDVERNLWGELSFELTCEGGIALYASTLPTFGEGLFQLVPLTRIAGVGCPWQPPALRDFYEIELAELPGDLDGLASGTRLMAPRLDREGAIWAAAMDGDALRPVRLEAGADRWQRMGDVTLVSRVFVSERGDRSVATALDDNALAQPVTWADDGWQPLDSTLPDGAQVTGLSEDGTIVLGTSISAGNVVTAWRWTDADGMSPLPVPEFPAGAPIPLFASDDGHTVVGGLRTTPTSGRLALHWSADEAATGLRIGAYVAQDPSACAVGCRIVFGNLAHFTGSPPFLRHQAWYRRDDGTHGVLPRLSTDPHHRHLVTDASRDGNIAVGTWGSFPSFSATIDAPKQEIPAGSRDGFIWTQHTGTESIRALLESAGHDTADWVNIDAEAITQDGDGILLTVEGPAHGEQLSARLAWLRLHPIGDR